MNWLAGTEHKLPLVKTLWAVYLEKYCIGWEFPAWLSRLCIGMNRGAS